MKKSLILCALILIAGCGYTTRGFVHDGSSIIVDPVINKIDITSENRRYSTYTSFPILIENRFTSLLVQKFNIDGGLKVVSQGQGALRITCTVNDYTKNTLRYTDGDDVREQRLRLHTDIMLFDADGEAIKTKRVIGEADYFLSGPNQKSEEAAQQDLIDDTARRIVEAVVEDW
jgi:outer membrane lipopolysaccharide assembly protein LptE/RlpB